jgi:hypothetical protein
MSLRLSDAWNFDAKPVEPESDRLEDEGEPTFQAENIDRDRELGFAELAQRNLCIFSFRATAGEGHNEFEFRILGVNDDEDRSRGRLKLSDFPQFKGQKVKVRERRLEGMKVLNYMLVDYPDGSYTVFDTPKSQIVTDFSDPGYFEYVIQ